MPRHPGALGFLATPTGLASIDRRQFLRMSAGFSVLSGVGLRSQELWAFVEPADEDFAEAVEYDLAVGHLGVSFSGESAEARAINGMIPGPLLRLKEGQDVILRVTNNLDETTSLHWHGLLVPFDMDGVPGFSYSGIEPGETFTYRFRARQSGTYWYHSHSGGQEQRGVYAPLVIDPAGDDPVEFDREHVIVLSDWTDEKPMEVLRNLKGNGGYYNYGKRTLPGFVKDLFDDAGAAIRDRDMWGRMRMDPTDLADVSGATYTFLLNGQTAEQNWTGLFRAGERVRLRIVNAAAMTYFDLKIPGLTMTVVQADGQDVEPVAVEEVQIATAETEKESGETDLGWIAFDRPSNPIESIMFTMRLDEVSPVIAYEHSYHILKIAEIKPAVVRPFEEVKEDIAHRVEFEKRRDALHEFASSLREGATVERVDSGGDEEQDEEAAAPS